MAVTDVFALQALEEEVRRSRQQYEALQRASEAQKREMTTWLQDLQDVRPTSFSDFDS